MHADASCCVGQYVVSLAVPHHAALTRLHTHKKRVALTRCGSYTCLSTVTCHVVIQRATGCQVHLPQLEISELSLFCISTAHISTCRATTSAQNVLGLVASSLLSAQSRHCNVKGGANLYSATTRNSCSWASRLLDAMRRAHLTLAGQAHAGIHRMTQPYMLTQAWSQRVQCIISVPQST